MTREELLRLEIDGFRKKIETLQAFITEYEQQLGVGSSPPPETAHQSHTSKQAANRSAEPLSKISGMIFFNKSQPEAAKALLGMVGCPLTTAQIMAGIEKGGVKVDGKNELAKKQNLNTTLNSSGELGRVAKDTWGLIGWPGVGKRKAADETDATSVGPSGTETKAPEKGGKK